jgi:hypothetical protein
MASNSRAHHEPRCRSGTTDVTVRLAVADACEPVVLVLEGGRSDQLSW